MLVQAKSILRTLLGLITGVDGTFEEVVIRLFKNNFTPNPDQVLGDLEEADFTGYAASSAVTWGTVFTNSDGFAEVIGSTKQFTATGSAVTNVVYGYYATNAAGDTLYWAERFSTPREMDEGADAIPIVPRYVFGQ